MAEVLPLFPLDWGRSASLLFRDDERLNDLIPGGEDLERVVLFSEDVWDLAGHRTWKDKSGAMTRINFTAVAERWRDAAKEMAVLQMNPALAIDRADNPMAQTWPNVQEPVAPVTAQGNIKMLGHALTIIDQQHITRFDSDDWARLVVLLVQPQSVKEKQAGSTLSNATGRGRAQQLITLWQVTEIANRSGLLGDAPPFDGRETVELFGGRTKQNAVRPHEGVGHALGFVAWVFDHIAEDIVAHIEWWTENASAEPPMSRQDTFEAMLDLTARIAHENSGKIPGSRNLNGGLTLAHAPLARLLGVYDADEAYLAGRWTMSQLRDTVQLTATLSPCPLPVGELPSRTGERIAWTERLIASKESLDIWQRRLVYYAMYYLAATVMLRDSQLSVLPFDPLKTQEFTRPDGSTYIKHTLSAYKTKNRHAAVPTSVVVNGRVARIIALLHRLQRALGYEPRRSDTTGVPFLFDQLLATPLGKRSHGMARDGLYLDLSFLKMLKEGARELYDRGVTKRSLDDIDISMRNVRITSAQAYAVREHGQALAAAFGQWDTAAVARGYVGDVYKLITPIDPDEATDLVHQDAGRRLHRAYTHRPELTGKGQARLDQTIETNRAALSNPQPLTPARLKTLGKRNRNIEQGPLTLCLYQIEGALCGGKGKPDFRLCLPGQCRNSVMAPADRARYELMRRQHLALKSDVLRRAADKMHDANPDIAAEFADTTDDELQDIITAHIDEYIRAALEDRA
ncbi:hypothetical protein [Symbioplanes lichenis]|uniref:hypothetical protein n=1 Tax=Symbioplanes lichenis TaxID=1629072 RepID=UPI00273A4646|nr:hypothetical protein [Actinoplanes lichenis]